MIVYSGSDVYTRYLNTIETCKRLQSTVELKTEILPTVFALLLPTIDHLTLISQHSLLLVTVAFLFQQRYATITCRLSISSHVSAGSRKYLMNGQ